MLSFKGGQLVHPIHLQMNASVGSSTTPNAVSESAESGAVVNAGFGFVEAGVELDSSGEAAYLIGSTVTGFAPTSSDYFEEIVQAGFPNVQSSAYIFGKRAFDAAFAAAAIAVTTPLMLLIAIAIKLTSRGPVFFRQERVGREGTVFEMLKFRTMRVADKTVTDTAWRALDDPRRTLVGSFLRRTSLDELPQFFNVVKGEMSVVGPRPERPFFVDRFGKEIPYYKLRHKGNVGITGLAQIRGFRGDTCIQSRVACDLEYLEQWSFTLDLDIIWGTTRRIFISDHE